MIVFNSVICFSQGINPAPENKAVVYFVRPSSMGFAINFSYFDSTKFIGKFSGNKYFRYECEPGVHLFWARSENKDFVEADVEAGKIYFIEALPKMGAVKAGVQLLPLDPNDPKGMKKIFKLVNEKPSESFTAEELEIEATSNKELIERGLEKYREYKAKGEIFERLERTMYYITQ